MSVNAANLWAPSRVLVSAGSLFVSDSGNARVAVWSAFPPTGNGASATFALGQSSLTAGPSGACNASTFQTPTGLGVSGNYLYVADAGFHRVLAFDMTSSGGIATWTGGESASFALGQTSLTACSANQGLTAASLGSLYAPQDLGTYQGASTTSLMITDTGNNRLLIFNTAPGATASADLELGQNDGTGSNPAASLLTASRLISPRAAGLINGSLWVADAALNRVLSFGPLPVASGGAALLALGQPDLVTAVGNQVGGGVGAQTLSKPVAVLGDSSNKIYVSDRGNNRVLIYNAGPGASGTGAAVVLGQSAMTTNASGSTAATLNGSAGLCLANGQLFISDSRNNRILVYNAFSSGAGNGQSATYTLGGAAASPSASSLSAPAALACTTGTLYVADTGNNRVLAFSLPITSSATAATLVLGQNDFASYGFNRGLGGTLPTANTMGAPEGLATDGTKLYVADTRNHRVLVWNQLPTQTGQAADRVVGQGSFGANFPDQGNSLPTLTSFHSPMGLSVANGYLILADTGNSRVLLLPQP